jgi:hypothetical protein
MFTRTALRETFDSAEMARSDIPDVLVDLMARFASAELPILPTGLDVVQRAIYTAEQYCA